MNTLLIDWDNFNDIEVISGLYNTVTNSNLLNDNIKVLNDIKLINLLTDYYLVNGLSPCISVLDELHLDQVELDNVIIIHSKESPEQLPEELKEMIKVLESNNNVKSVSVYTTYNYDTPVP